MKDLNQNSAASIEAQVEEVEQVLSFEEIKKAYASDMNDGNPSVYCSTYFKYNCGRLTGLWLDLTKFSDYDEFIDICRQLHADEADPELMFQDYENFPGKLYCESCMGEDVFDKIIEYSELSDDDKEAFDDYLDLGYKYDLDAFREAYQGQFDTEADFADYIVSECYDLDNMMGNLSYYFDYEKFGRDLFMTDYDMGDHGHVFRAC